MTATLSDSFQFDLHARYATLGAILTSALSASDRTRILDVGAGPQRLTEQCLPPGFAKVTRTDVEGFDDDDLVTVAPGAPLPFADAEFDAVVAMDVLEHVPPAERGGFLRECLRVAAKLTVIAAPIGCPAVAEAERDYAQAYRSLFKADEPFLVEHEGYGLPTPEAVVSALQTAGAGAVVTIDNVRLADWVALNVANLVLSTVNDGDAARSAASRLQNADIPAAYRGGQHYRRFYVCTRDPELAARLAAQFGPETLPEDEGRPSEPLVVLAEELKRYATRYHGPTLEACVADRELAVKTLEEVMAAKDRHIVDLQAIADGLAERVRNDDVLHRTIALIEQQATTLEGYAQALHASTATLQATREALDEAREALNDAHEALHAEQSLLKQIRDASFGGRARRAYRWVRSRLSQEAARS